MACVHIYEYLAHKFVGVCVGVWECGLSQNNEIFQQKQHLAFVPSSSSSSS